MYIDNLKPLCSSLEQSSDTAILPPPMRITEDGYSAWLTSQNDLGIQRYMAVLGKGHYLVMVDPASLVDVVPFGEIQWMPPGGQLNPSYICQKQCSRPVYSLCR